MNLKGRQILDGTEDFWTCIQGGAKISISRIPQSTFGFFFSAQSLCIDTL